MRRIDKKQRYRLERSFLDTVLLEGLRIFPETEHGETGECKFRFSFARQHASRKKEKMDEKISVTVKTLLDTTLLPPKVAGDAGEK